MGLLLSGLVTGLIRRHQKLGLGSLSAAHWIGVMRHALSEGIDGAPENRVECQSVLSGQKAVAKSKPTPMANPMQSRKVGVLPFLRLLSLIRRVHATLNGQWPGDGYPDRSFEPRP